MVGQITATGGHVLRELNVSAVLAQLRAEGTQRFAELAQATGLSRPAVTRAVNELEELGWVEYLPADNGRPGRPAQAVRFRADAGHVVGVDIGPHKMMVIVADLTGSVVAEARADVSTIRGESQLIAALRQCVERALTEAGARANSVQAINVGTPGIVDPDSGQVVLVPSMPGWTGDHLLADLKRIFHCPIQLDNDVKLAVRGERWRGAAADGGTVVFVQWGARVGAAIMIADQVHRGASNDAGDLGFLDLALSAEQSTRGRDSAGLGPFERAVGVGAIMDLAVKEARDAGDGGLARRMRAARKAGDVAPLFAAAEDGDPVAGRVVDLVAARFAAGLAVLRVVLDPDLVVVGGGLSQAGPILLDAVQRQLKQRVLAPHRVELSTLGDTAVALGAIRAALDYVEEKVFPRPIG